MKKSLYNNLIIPSILVTVVIILATCKKESISPLEPFDPHPANGSTESSTDIKLSWTISNPDGDNLIYDIYLGTSANPSTIIGSDRIDTSLAVKDIKADVMYYWKVVAKAQYRPAVSSKVWTFTVHIGEIIFNPDLDYGSVADIDGNNYKTIHIGTQVWMAENLKTTRYNNGTEIPSLASLRGDQYKPLYGWYNNDEVSFKPAYGAIYNGYSVSTGKLCPVGWHVPTDVDWNRLATYLGGVSVAGGKLKESGTSHWKSPNTGATNESGFTALPAGFRFNGAFRGTGTDGIFWSSTGISASDPYFFNMFYNSTILNVFVMPQYQILSVRCLKDE
jgi:uncharacterized protein (TIGR02145 family)